MTDLQTLLAQLVYYFPYYVAFVLIPMVIRSVVEKLIGIPLEAFEESTNPLLRIVVDLSYEDVFAMFTLTALFYPLFEELLFRGIPLLFFGPLGAIVGSVVWVLMHPAWQLKYLSNTPLRLKIAFTLTSCFYYACNAVFYTLMWLNGAGLAAIIYHMAHNAWLTAAEVLKRISFDINVRLWKRYKFVKERPVAESEISFAKRTMTLEEVAEEAKRFMFVKRR